MCDVCVFISTEDVFEEKFLEQRMEREVEGLILEGYTTFRMGNRETFDFLALRVCRKLREKYPHINIEVVYNCHRYFLFERASVRRKYEKDVENFYGDVKMKSYHVESVPLIYRLVANNRAMVADAEVVVCYLRLDCCGGVEKYVRYAQNLGKRVVNLFHKCDLKC